ncbi:MAG: hypothetical protein JWR88_16 [Pseudonocardia sp.]|nr:hypothetical protein [Pseudonocardia sp.]
MHGVPATGVPAGTPAAQDGAARAITAPAINATITLIAAPILGDGRRRTRLRTGDSCLPAMHCPTTDHRKGDTDVVLYIHRELIHHRSEVCLLRDLYLHTKPATNGATR